MSTMVRFNNDNLANVFMTDEQIRKVCPLAFAEAPTRSVSDKYVQANTATVIEDMRKLGWGVVDARQRKAQKGSSGQFSYHMVSFQHPDIKILKEVDGQETIDCYPRIILQNSHDGLNAFRFSVGLFRLVCSNGLIIATDQMVDIKIRHIHYNFEELRTVIAKAIEDLPGQVEVMNNMKQVELNEDQRKEMALQFLKIRKNIDEAEEYRVDDETLTDMLTPMRKEDEGSDLWSVFNVLQEKVIKGGFSVAQLKDTEQPKKARKMRKVTSFIKDLDFNRRMFATASRYLQAA